jgi:hypothetical protein
VVAVMSAFDGWPFPAISKTEAASIVVVHDELMLHDASMVSDRAWFLACQIVARIRRDVK